MTDLIAGPVTEPATTDAPRPVVTREPELEVVDRPRPLTTRTLDDRLTVAGAAVGSLCLVAVAFFFVLPLSGVLGFAICWAVTFLAMRAGLTAMNNPWPVVVDTFFSGLVLIAAMVVGIAIFSTLAYTFIKGFPALTHLNFFTQDMGGVRPTDSLDHGGILHAIIGTMIMVAIAIVISVPLGIATAVYMTDVGGRYALYVRTVIESMTALPDILAGLFVYVTLIIALGWERSGFAAAVALSITMIPITARTAEVQLRIVPGGLREAGLALGSSKWAMVRRVVLPTAKAGLATAVILAIARGVGETAPVLLTSGASTFVNGNPFVNPMNSLPLFVFSGVRSGQEQAIARAFGAASVLLLLVLILFVVMRALTRQKGSRR